MKLSLSVIALSFLVACNEAASVTFRVVAPGATDVQVSVNNKAVKLSPKFADVPYFTGQADADAGAKYKYIVSGKEEGFDRTLESGRAETLNDFYDRPVTYANIPELPWPIKDGRWNRAGKKESLFDSNYIPTIFMNGNPDEMKNLVKNVPKTDYKVKFTYIGADEVQVFDGVEFGLHGAGKKHNNNKQSWKWKLPKGKLLANRDYFKLRHMEEDPTQIREKLYADILGALGSYGNEANMVRLFINGEGFGTFNLLDDVRKYSYVNARFFGGKPPKEQGPLFDGASGADFAYYPDGSGYYSFEDKTGEHKPKYDPATYLNPICKKFSEVKYEDDSQIATFSKAFDVDQFLRFMVMEFLTGHWDGYWQGQTNDGAYQDPTDKKWYYLGQDYDATFGVNLAEPEGRDFVNVPYDQYSTRYPKAVLINNLLKNNAVKTKFETYLKDTVQILFNNVTLTNHILTYHEFILPDLKWDRSIVQQSPGFDFGWKFDQVTENLWKGVTSPTGQGGGADWGLIEWIIAKSQAVAKKYDIKITDKVVGPPNSGDSKSTKDKSTGRHTANDVVVEAASTTNAAGHALPSVALIGAAAMVAALL